MRKFNLILFGVSFLLFLNFASSISLTSSANTGSYQYTSPNFNNIYTSSEMSTYWPILKQMENGNCNASADFLVSIPPGGCSPAVVRSDLLEDQRVPVFCQLSAVKINPLVQVSSIKSISFQGAKPKGVVDISFHPARAAIRSYNTVLGSPVMNNIGYVVIILEKNVNESSMMDWVYGNLTATMYYDIDKAYGTGQAEYYLPIISNEEWDAKFKNYGFWNGKGFLRAENIEEDNAKVSLYLDKDNPYHSLNLKVGEQSNTLYFPFSYCKAGLQVKLNSITSEEDQALLNLDGNQIWVKKNSKILNDRCSVSDLRILPDKTGTVDISCPQKKLSLSILPRGAIFSTTNGQKSFAIGDKVSTNYYLAYSGVLPNSISDRKNEAFVIVAKQSGQDIKKLSVLISEKIYNLVNSKINQNYLSAQFKSDIEGSYSGNVQVLFMDGDIEGQTFSGIVEQTISKKFSEDTRNMGAGEVLDDYVSRSNSVLDNLIEDYPQEKGQYDQTTFSEEALFDSIKTAKQTQNIVLLQSLGTQFLKLYPNSRYAYDVNSIVGLSSLFDLSQSQDIIFVNNENHFISLDELKPIDKLSKKARLLISGVKNEEVYEGKTVYLIEGDSSKARSDYLEVQKISVGEVTIVYHHKTAVAGANPSLPITYTETTETKVIKENIAQDFFGRAISVQNIDVRRVAYVSLNPHIDNSKSIADFTFRIGIEKRDIQLSDEKTKEMIKNLNASIKKWEDINTKLGNLIKTWKGVCFATSIVLMAKSTIAGFSGQGIARQKVMEAYRSECDSNPELKKMTHSECYDKLSKNIDQDVAGLTNSIKTQNDVIKQIQEGCKSSQGSLFSGAVVNEDCVKGEMRKAIKSKNGGKDTVTVTIGNQRTEVPLKEIDNYDTLRELMAEQNVLGDSVAGKAINTEINSELKAVAQVVKEKQAVIDAGKSLGSVYSSQTDIVRIEDLDDQNRIGKVWGGDTLGRLKDKSSVAQAVLTSPSRPTSLPDETPIQFVQSGGRPYLLILQATAGGGNGLAYKPVYVLDATGGSYKLLDDGATLTQTEQTSQTRTASQIKSGYTFYSGGSCANLYSNAKVQYYDTGNSKGMPAIVPINLKDGWYAKVSQSPGGLLSTEQQGYKQSGQVSFFYLCNVGPDGLEKNGKWPDDICMSIDTNNYAKYTEFAGCPSMKGAQFKKLIEDAQQAIRDAASQYGSKTVRVLGQTIDTGISVDGNNAAECQDFMSPDDCKILFNVCDPVICPASRCNLGGAYPVSNVIQSGIIGSIFLCLPNIKEGVIIPVCLSGIYAGIENFVSILRSERECLQKSLDTGQHVGICDEITSVYMCEFFWRQLAPVINILIPRLIESAYGQGTRGGGEYLSVKNSWDGLQKNIDYFKNTYAQNAFRAFEIRNVEEAGTPICQAFLGTSLPTSASALDNLLDPESPEQVSAWFSETSYTEATVPATSQYKVYFHIFAGNDQGVQYRVYLKSPPDSSYYQSTGVVNVKNGYIAKGGTADESIDFTAPSGYQELCVDINAQSKCGFKAVSTSFALDYLSKKYTEEQAQTAGITKEKDCISGTPSILSSTNPNIQARAESAVSPSANLQGIVRVCSTEEPGKATDTTAVSKYDETSLGRYVSAGGQSSGDQVKTVNFNKRWQLVGYCDNPNIGCWLDTESVKKDVQQVQAIDNSLSSLEQQVANLDSSANKVTDETAREAISRISKNLSSTTIDQFVKKLPSTNDRDQIAGVVNNFILTNEQTLIELGGTSGADGIVAKATTNTDIANALMLRVKLYNFVVQALYKKYFSTTLQVSTGTTVVTPTPASAGVSFSCSNSVGDTYDFISPASYKIRTLGGVETTLTKSDFEMRVLADCSSQYNNYLSASGQTSMPPAEDNGHVQSINFYDSDGNEITDSACTGGANNLMDIFLEVKADSTCKNLRCDVYYRHYEKTRIATNLNCMNTRINLKSILKNELGGGTFFVSVNCTSSGKEIETAMSGEITYLKTNCPATVI